MVEAAGMALLMSMDSLAWRMPADSELEEGFLAVADDDNDCRVCGDTAFFADRAG